MKIKTIAFLAVAGVLASSSIAKVNFSLDIESLTSSGGAELSNSGLLVLVVDAGDDDFTLPSAGSFGEEVIASWDLSAVGPGTSDITLNSGGVAYGSNWDAGDPLALLWFPGLGASDMPSGSEEYGIFTDTSGLTSGNNWEMPVDNTILHRLTIITSTATKLRTSGGEVPEAVGMAVYAVGGASPVEAPVPSMLAASDPVGGASTLSWTGASEPAGGYIIQRKRAGSSSGWETIGFTGGSTTTYSDGSVVPGLSYDYQILSQSGLGSAQSASSLVIEAERSVFINLAARGHIVPDSANRDWTLMNAGIVLAGNDPFKRMLGIGIGPYNGDRLNQPWLEDTTMLLEFARETVAENDNWMRDFDNPESPNPDAVDLNTAMMARGTPSLPVDDAGSGFVGMDSAILEDMARGANIFKIFSKDPNAAPGFVGIQAYDAEYEGSDNPVIHDNRIINLSSKGLLAENGVFNGSLTISGNVPKEVLALVRGPALALKGVVATLENPKMILKRGTDVLAENDDWDNPIAAVNVARGLLKVETSMDRIRAAIVLAGQDPDDHTLDSAMLVTLAPGSQGYIFKVEAADGSTSGEGTVQIQITEIEME